MKKIIIAALCLSAFGAYAQKKKDIASIKAMCGCYEVTFNFAETFAPDKNYAFHDNYRSGALEYIFPVEESKNKIALQHLLVINDTMIIKHWRQDWIYENTDFYTFYKDNTWKYVSKPASEVKGQWSQKVFQVDDSPRYEGSATWVHVDGKDYWESTSDAPLPRREFTKRDDYNVMVRINRQEITEYGWVHEQDNRKVIRTDEGDQWLASEKGWNTYEKVADSRCEPARKWWSKTGVYWADVRTVWDELFATKEQLKIRKKVDDKILWQKLFALEDEMLKAPYNPEKSRTEIRKTIKAYLVSDEEVAFRK